MWLRESTAHNDAVKSHGFSHGNDFLKGWPFS